MPRPPAAHIQVEGYREFVRASRKAVDSELPKRIGQAHKEVGRFIISKLEPPPVPEAVGAGYGAAVRPSATKREVVLMVGGKHRDRGSFEITRMTQWGKRFVGVPGRRHPKRPYIIQTALKHETEIRQKLQDEVLAALHPAFYKAE